MPEFLLAPDRWPRLPAPHRTFLERALPLLRADRRLTGLAAGGSFIPGALDEYSDLDLVVVTLPPSAAVIRSAAALAGSLGPLLAAFPGDHVGEPRLLICLYGPPLLHVDLKFVTEAELAHRVEDPVVLWDREGGVRRGLAQGAAVYPPPDVQWIEDRFWVWVHYAQGKIARGELFEAIDMLGFVRKRVLGPLALMAAGTLPNGVRRVEEVVQGRAAGLAATLAIHDRDSCTRALAAAIALYRELRDAVAPRGLQRRDAAEREVTRGK